MSKIAVFVLLVIAATISLLHPAYSDYPSEHKLYPSHTVGVVIGTILVWIISANVLLRLFGSRKRVVCFGMLIVIIASFFIGDTFGILLTELRITWSPLVYGTSILIGLLLIVSGILSFVFQALGGKVH